jgi:transposase-like protein
MDRMKIYCLFCGKEIINPKQFGREVIQKFCSKNCRFNWHNRRKLEPFTKELTSLLKKYGYAGGKDG